MAEDIGVYWPQELPCWLLDSHEGQDEEIFARTPVDYGPARLRRMYPTVPHVRKAALFLHGDLPKLFHEFFENDLDVGSRRFLAPFREIGGFERFYVCEFVEPYSAEYVSLAGAKRAWRVQCAFRLYGDGMDSPYLAPAELALELGIHLRARGNVTPTAALALPLGIELNGVCARFDLGTLGLGIGLTSRTSSQSDLMGLQLGIALSGEVI